MKLTFIGNGNMAKALIEGMVTNYEIEVLGRNETTLTALKKQLPQITIKVMDETEDITGKHIILAVKPYSLPDLAPKLRGKQKPSFQYWQGLR